mmetsp:Transcript_106174/g.342477  ORF Transcript_106174/g.342477 Transcript_106174/m.342477 type:complete len:452 (+) Transcript_106174:128-1483(+)
MPIGAAVCRALMPLPLAPLPPATPACSVPLPASNFRLRMALAAAAGSSCPRRPIATCVLVESGCVSTSPPIRLSIHSLKETPLPLGRMAARASRIRGSPPALESVGGSGPGQASMKSRMASRRRSSAGRKPSVGRPSKKASRLSATAARAGSFSGRSSSVGSSSWAPAGSSGGLRPRRGPRRETCTWPRAFSRVWTSPPMRRSIQSLRATSRGSSAALHCCRLLSLPASASTGGAPCVRPQASRKSSSAWRSSSSVGKSSSAGRPSKNSARTASAVAGASRGSRGSRASRASRPPDLLSASNLPVTSCRAAAVRCTTYWPLRSCRSSNSPPMRRSIQSRSVTPCGSSAMRACCTALSPPACERVANSLDFQAARKSKSAPRKRSSSWEKDPEGRVPKKASRFSSFPAAAATRHMRVPSSSSKSETSAPMRRSIQAASVAPRGKNVLAIELT